MSTYPVDMTDYAPIYESPQGSSKANDYQVGGDHYRSKGIQPWDAMEAWMSPDEFAGFLRGNAIKYLSRFGAKTNEDVLRDVMKAKHYIEKLIEQLQKEQ